LKRGEGGSCQEPFFKKLHGSGGVVEGKGEKKIPSRIRRRGGLLNGGKNMVT